VHAADTFLDRNHVQEAVPYGTTLDEAKPKAKPGAHPPAGTPTTSTSIPKRPSGGDAPTARPAAPAK